MGLLDKLFKKEKKEKEAIKSKARTAGKKELVRKGKEKKIKKQTKFHPKPQVEKRAAITSTPRKTRKKYKEAYRILKRPLVTEKATDLGQNSQYTFEVVRNANKVEIGKAVESVFDVHVTNVRTLNMRGKIKKYRGKKGKTSDWKKAVVSLRKGEKIEVIEEA